MPDFAQKKQELEKEEKKLQEKKEDFLFTVKHGLSQIAIYVEKMKHNKFELKGSRYLNDFTGDMEYHLKEMKEAFEEAEEMESSFISKKEDLEEEMGSKEASVWGHVVSKAMKNQHSPF